MLWGLFPSLSSPYGMMAGFGVLAGLLVLGYNLAAQKQPAAVWVKTAAAVLAGGLAIMPAARFGQWVFRRGWQAESDYAGGISFYPGLLGFLAVCALAALLLRLPVAKTLNTIAPSVPLFHAFGRIGCWFGGCCYGMPLAFGVPGFHFDRLPTQLMEAAFCLGLFFVLEYRVERHRLPVYLGSYAVWRFCLEFVRGDAHRGALLPGVPGTPAQQIAVLCLLGLGLWWAARRLRAPDAPQRGKEEKQRVCPQKERGTTHA